MTDLDKKINQIILHIYKAGGKRYHRMPCQSFIKNRREAINDLIEQERKRLLDRGKIASALFDLIPESVMDSSEYNYYSFAEAIKEIQGNFGRILDVLFCIAGWLLGGEIVYSLIFIPYYISQHEGGWYWIVYICWTITWIWLWRKVFSPLN